MQGILFFSTIILYGLLAFLIFLLKTNLLLLTRFKSLLRFFLGTLLHLNLLIFGSEGHIYEILILNKLI